jgi:peptidoglycan biosynthesis protein MviN/MurJ (putative lipid II flippase)
VVLNLALNLLFVFTWPDGWKHVGLAVATVICSVVNCSLLVWLLRRKFGALRLRAVFPVVARLLVISLVMGFAAYYSEREIALSLTRAGWPYKLVEALSVGGAMAAAAGLYGGLSWMFCRGALLEMVGDLKSRRRRGA